MAYIEVKGLKYQYPATETMALKGLDFSVEKGEFIGVTGENNSGKSTLCQAFVGLVPNFYRGAYGGSITIDGLDVAKASNAEICTTVGLVFQNPYNQFSGACDTVFDEIAFGLQNIGIEKQEMIRRVNEAMEMLDIAAYRDRNPFDLSGGQQQRVAIAGILAMKPQVLVLDEPTSQLDPQGSEEVFKAIDTMTQAGITIIIAEHKIEKIAEFADKILLLKDGLAADFDTPEKVFSRSDLASLGIDPPVYTLAAEKLGKRKPESGLYPVTLSDAAECIGTDIPRVVLKKRDEYKIEPTFDVSDIAFSYDGQKNIIEHLSLKLDSRPTAIIGQNGAGKTTLVKLLKGLLKPTEGSITLAGEDVVGQTVASLSSKIGYVFQNPNDQVFKNNVMDEVMFGPLNIGFTKEEARESSIQALREVQLEWAKDINPYDLGLSDRKLVAIASVLAMDTDIVIFDEPTIAQDRKGKERIADVIRKLEAEGKGVIGILHDMDFVAQCFDRVIIMAKGTILADDEVHKAFTYGPALDQAKLEPPHIAKLMKAIGVSQFALSVDEIEKSANAGEYI
ncbi:MAG: ATP-binding cassette domain-containing protein [Eubacteriaceae bacterium]|nr:ATP-binding cassette domain-containing protein [Eubacteriaceae bacterium]